MAGMAGMAGNPPPGAAVVSGTTGIPPSLVNAYRIATVVDRLAAHLRGDGRLDATEFYNFCISLARGIDYSVANNEVPARAQDLPLLLKLVCRKNNDSSLLASVMVLMISVKNACKVGWFSTRDTDELLNLANEIGSGFGSLGYISDDQIYLPTISKILSRFYPQMKIGQKLAFVEAKPGYGAYVVDFRISKTTKSSPLDKIRLFVAETDNIETSSCIISPPKVSFILNGMAVERRANVYMDAGPQIPTNVTGLVKFGSNLLQAVGQFNGHYIIIIAFMSMMPLRERSTLPDHVQPVAAAFDKDMEVIEGASRISLCCPISLQRIKTPVKGWLCKHLQCFDFNNFVDINLTSPKWRCPHCNQSVCYTDIRIDRNMVKVLSEVGENVADVIISADGSWKPVLDSNDSKQQPHGNSKFQREGSEHSEVTNFSDPPSNMVDLGEGDDEMDSLGAFVVEERKPCCDDMNHLSVGTSQILEDDFWAGISSLAPGPIIGGVTGISPVLTDAVSPALTREATDCLQSIVNKERGRLSPSIPWLGSRTPVAAQAVPAQPSRASPSLTPAADGLAMPDNIERQRHYSPALSHPRTTQNRNHQHTQLPSTRTLHTSSHLSSTSMPQVHRLRTRTLQEGVQAGIGYAGGPGISHYAQLMSNSRQAEQRILRAAMMVGGGQEGALPTVSRTNQQPYVNFDGRASWGDLRCTPGSMQPASRVCNSGDPMVENWRPMGRMRGSLTGQAYSSMSQYIIQPTQLAQATQSARPPPPPPVSVSSASPVSVPPHLHSFLAAGGGARLARPQNYSAQVSHLRVETSNGAAGSGSSPNRSSGVL